MRGAGMAQWEWQFSRVLAAQMFIDISEGGGGRHAN